MLYFTIAFYLISYAFGFVNMTLVGLRWYQTRDRANLAVFLFLVAFTVYNWDDNLGYFLDSIFKLPDAWSGLPFLALSAAVYAVFHLAILDFTHSLTVKPKSRWFRWALILVALSPLVIVAVEVVKFALGLSTRDSRVEDLENFALISVLLLVYNTGWFAANRRTAEKGFFSQLVRMVVVLNLVFFPLFALEIFFDFQILKGLSLKTMDNAYYVTGGIACAILIIRHHYGPTKDAEPNREGPVHFSRREREIIALIEKGLSNKEVSAALFIEVSTVKNHLYRLYRRTRTRNRAELVRLTREADPTNNGSR